MSVVNATVALRDDTPLESSPHVSSRTGDPIGWLRVGESEVGLWGQPVALRRLARELERAAEDAERLAAAERELTAVGGGQR